MFFPYRKKQRKFAKNNTEKIRQKTKKYNEKHSEERSIKNKEYYKNNKQEIRSRQRHYYKFSKNMSDSSEKYMMFKKETKDGPIFVCNCCRRVLFKRGMYHMNQT